jgi:hypothetical protein
MKRVAACTAVHVLRQGRRKMNFEKRSVTTRQKSKPEGEGDHSKKSSVIASNGREGAGRGCRTP